MILLETPYSLRNTQKLDRYIYDQLDLLTEQAFLPKQTSGGVKMHNHSMT